jgi:hypothetical protein
MALCLQRTMTRPKPMRLLSAALILALLTAAFGADAAIAGAASGRHRPANLTLHAQLYKPDGDGPFPP